MTYQYTFKHNVNRKLSVNATYQTNVTKTSFNFPEQAHFNFGVASVLPNGAHHVGKQFNMYDYICKNICTCKMFEKHIKEEQSQVENLKGKFLLWCVDMHPKGEVWADDGITSLNGL